MQKKQRLLSAEFEPVLKKYLYIIVTGWLCITMIGIPLIPFWLIFGFAYCKRYFERLDCYLTKQTLEVKKGWLFRVEKTIPLDKIQDLTFREGPLLRALGISILDVETAGQGNAQGNSDAKIIGIRGAREFRDRVLAQRDIVVANENISMKTDSGGNEISGLLKEIRDSLRNIEKNLNK